MESIKETIINSILTKTPISQTVTATLADGQEATYTKEILPMMIGDKFVKKIVDNADGNIIYMVMPNGEIYIDDDYQ